MELTAKRYVAFFDIMGFKDLVERNNHEEVVKILQKLKDVIKTIGDLHNSNTLPAEIKIQESKSVTFSDSIIIFSKDESQESLTKILIDSAIVIAFSIGNGIPIKGALSHGEITIDFDNSLFFGRPIIDAYLLHDELQLYSAILDHKIQKKVNESTTEFNKTLIFTHKAKLKAGKITHTLIRPVKSILDRQLISLNQLYETVSGAPRVYIDNTIDFLNDIKTTENWK